MFLLLLVVFQVQLIKYSADMSGNAMREQIAEEEDRDIQKSIVQPHLKLNPAAHPKVNLAVLLRAKVVPAMSVSQDATEDQDTQRDADTEEVAVNQLQLKSVVKAPIALR